MCPVYCPLLFVFVCSVVSVIGHKNEMKYISNVNLESTVQFGVVHHLQHVHVTPEINIIHSRRLYLA